MLNIETILENWKKDSEIDETNLDEASRQTAKLHGKYLEMFTTSKLLLKRSELQQKILLKDKWLYFSGKMDKSEMDLRGWPYDPFNGLKVMKSDMEYFFNSDPELQKSEEKIIYLKSLVEALEEIINNIRWRHSTIKNMIDWKRFASGG